MATNYVWSLTGAEVTGGTTKADAGKLSTHAACVNITSGLDTSAWTINAAATATATGVTVDTAVASVLFNGSTAKDVLNVSAGMDNVTFNGGAGADKITFADSVVDNVSKGHTINGGAGVDTITLGKYTEATIVYDSVDILQMATPVSNVGTKITLSAAGQSAGVTWNFTTATGFASAGITYGATTAATLGKDVTKVIGSSNVDTLTAASTRAMTLDGGAGADKLYGTAGSTTTFIYDAADALVDGKGGKGILDATAQTANLQLFMTDNAVFKNMVTVKGGSGNDELRGSATTNLLDGGKGNDQLWAAGNAATLTGGAGTDGFWYGAGEANISITYDQDATASLSADDTVNLYNISAYDLVGQNAFTNGGTNGVLNIGGKTITMLNASGKTDATRHFVSEEGWKFDVVFAATGTKATGTAGVIDNLVATAGGNTLDGKGGNDNLYGGAGDDTFVYYAGDQIYSMTGNDTIDATQTTAAATIWMSDMLAGTTKATAWTINGSKYADNIRGTASIADTIVAGDGDDVIWGGAGVTNDTLTGGRGVDTYYYGLDEGSDTIKAGTVKSDSNAGDVVNFYNVAATSDLQVALSGDNLVFTVNGTQGAGSLTLENWNTTDKLNKLTNFVVSDVKYTFDLDADGKAVWTKA